jgi:hypothetical protein
MIANTHHRHHNAHATYPAKTSTPATPPKPLLYPNNASVHARVQKDQQCAHPVCAQVANPAFALRRCVRVPKHRPYGTNAPQADGEPQPNHNMSIKLVPSPGQVPAPWLRHRVPHNRGQPERQPHPQPNLACQPPPARDNPLPLLGQRPRHRAPHDPHPLPPQPEPRALPHPHRQTFQTNPS